jgi:hypothetical protein
MMRRWMIVAGLSFLLAACGGGGSNNAPPSSLGSAITPGSAPPPVAANQVGVIVDAGPSGTSVNQIYVSVTVCAPNTGNCQTIDHVLVDTGSSGLRLIASAVNASLVGALPAVTDAAGGNPLGECLPFVNGYSWGPVRSADVTIGQEKLSGIAVQIIGLGSFNATPSGCASNNGQAMNTVASFGANGILGIGVWAQDCGQYCANFSTNPQYYACTSTTCSTTKVPVDSQVWNPVALMSSDNNGSLLTLPATTNGVATVLNGTLTFGIGTQSNNGLGSATILTVDSNGELSANVAGTIYPYSFLDSGSNAYFYGSNLFPLCTGQTYFYCPSSATSQPATLTGVNGNTATADFIVGNANQTFNAYPGIHAYDQLAGPGWNGTVDLGLPFFYGKTVATAIAGRSTPAGNGPWLAILTN